MLSMSGFKFCFIELVQFFLWIYLHFLFGPKCIKPIELIFQEYFSIIPNDAYTFVLIWNFFLFMFFFCQKFLFTNFVITIKICFGMNEKCSNAHSLNIRVGKNQINHCFFAFFFKLNTWFLYGFNRLLWSKRRTNYTVHFKLYHNGKNSWLNKYIGLLIHGSGNYKILSWFLNG